MNSSINLNLYKYFYEVAKYNSYTKAAESLMISQPSLSYSIKTLENQLEKRLFIRDKNKISLTDDGKIIYEKLKNIFLELNEITCNKEDISGKIILGVRSIYANKILPFYINELNKIYPNLEIEFTIASSVDLLRKFKSKEIDILLDEYELDGDITSKLIYEDDTVFFTTKNNYEDVKDKINKKYLENNEVCIIKRNRISKEIEKLYPNFKYNIIQSTPLMLKKMADSNLVGISPKAVIAEELRKQEYIILNTGIILPKSKMYISYFKRLENEKIKAITDFFKEHNFYQL